MHAIISLRLDYNSRALVLRRELGELPRDAQLRFFGAYKLFASYSSS